MLRWPVWPQSDPVCIGGWGVPRHFNGSKTLSFLTFCSIFVYGITLGPGFSCDNMSSVWPMAFEFETNVFRASRTSDGSACRGIFGGKTGIFIQKKKSETVMWVSKQWTREFDFYIYFGPLNYLDHFISKFVFLWTRVTPGTRLISDFTPQNTSLLIACQSQK